MRVDCKFYESRTYASGEVVRMCRLDLAPDAPWRCPEDCKGYQRRMVDVGWSHGTLTSKPAPNEPAAVDTGDAAALLDMAEEILNSAGPKIIADVEKERNKKKKWRRKR
jgi:hypothetical protein